MHKIKELKQQIASMEDEVTKLNHADTSGDYYKKLYALLSIAYFASKDLNELYEGNIPIVEDNASKVALRDAEDTIIKLRTEVKQLQDIVDKVINIVVPGLT